MPYNGKAATKATENPLKNSGGKKENPSKRGKKMTFKQGVPKPCGGKSMQGENPMYHGGKKNSGGKMKGSY